MPISTTKAPAGLTKDSAPILLDTHMAVWLASSNPRLKPATLALIESAFHLGKLCLSTIAAWEIGLLVAQEKLDLGQPPLVWFNGFVEKFKIEVIELTPEIAIASSFVPGTFHRDPADRLLVATALAHSASIITADKKIVTYGKLGFVHVIAC